MGKVKRVLQAEEPHRQSLGGEKGPGLFEAGAWGGCWVMKSGHEVRWCRALNDRLGAETLF